MPIVNPYEKTESAWNPRRDLLHVYGEAYEPKVKVRNNIYPDLSETHNCATCLWGEKEHPAFVIKSPDTFKVKCTLRTDMSGRPIMSEGPRHEDISCPVWNRRKEKEFQRK